LGGAGKTFNLGNDGGANTRVITVNGSHTIAGQITGDNSLSVAGGGSLTLSGNNTFSGGAQISDGTILVGNNAALGTGTFTFNFANALGSRVLASSTTAAYTLNNNFNVFDNVITIGQTSGGTGSLTLGGAGKNFNLGSDGETKSRLITVNGSHTIAGNLTGGANNNFVKLGDGTITIGGTNNSFAGGLYIDSGVVNLSGAPLTGGSVLDIGGGANGNAVNASSATLRVSATNSYGRNIVINAETNSSGVAGTRAIEFAHASGLATLTGAIAAEKSFSANVAESTATGVLSGAISGAGGLTKTGSGTLTLSGAGANTYSGTTTVSAGVLNLNKSVSNAVNGDLVVGSGTTDSSVKLLLSTSNQVGSSGGQTVTLSGGTIQRASGVSEVFGNLNITAASFLNFGSGTEGNLQFQSYQNTGSALVAVQNFFAGNTLQFASSTFNAGNLSQFTFDNGYTTSIQGSYFTITAIPEPSTYLAAAGLLAMFLWPARRRLIKDTKSILGLRAPARDRLAH
jgi:autotransporter-associated beta strand protein